ncbi:MAG: HD-GYP domain-containing protein [Armatimonadetes bacterium]|nr:HD-GYP domain-containing protein [Armatimonadota bacterium]
MEVAERLPAKARRFILLLTVLASAILLWAGLSLSFSSLRNAAICLAGTALTLGIILVLRGIPTDEEEIQYEYEEIGFFFVLFLFGPSLATLTALICTMAGEVIALLRGRLSRSRWILAVGNCANSVICAASACLVLCLILWGKPLFPPSLVSALAVLGAGATFLIVNLLITGIHLTTRGTCAWKEAWARMREMALPDPLFLLPSAFGALGALILRERPEAFLLLGIPFFAFCLSLQLMSGTRREVRQTLGALTQVLDARDHYTLGHSERVAGFAAVLARRLDLGLVKERQIHFMGLIHDLGKVAIRDDVLLKNDTLTFDEFRHIQSHPAVTRVILEPLGYVRKYAQKASLHHERYDGGGYPFGLRGSDIPQEARILAVADTWDALTSDRPYRKGMDDTRAVQILQLARGCQLDPEVVDAFLDAYQEGAINETRLLWRKIEEERVPRSSEESLFHHALARLWADLGALLDCAPQRSASATPAVLARARSRPRLQIHRQIMTLFMSRPT